jgi:hypothetical protein
MAGIEMLHDRDRGGERGRQVAKQLADGADASRGCRNGDNIEGRPLKWACNSRQRIRILRGFEIRGYDPVPPLV